MPSSIDDRSDPSQDLPQEKRRRVGLSGPDAASATDPGVTSAAAAAVVGDVGFDRVLERLRGVVERLETGSLGLEESLIAFEEGVRLSRRGADILDRAERRVEVLLKGPGAGDPEGDRDQVGPFPGLDEDAVPADNSRARPMAPRGKPNTPRDFG